MKLFNVFMVLTLLMGCAGMATSRFDKSNTVGIDVDEVIAEIEKMGLSVAIRPQ